MKTEINFASMGKMELRAACKEHGIKNYGAMNNEGMRTALIRETTKPDLIADLRTPAVAAVESAVVETAPVAETEVAATDSLIGNVFGSMFAPVVLPKSTTPSRMVVDGKVHTGTLPPVQQHAKREAAVIPPAPVRPVLPKGGYKVEKVRETRNGKTRPSVGTICAALWDMFDTNPEIRAKNLFTLADANGWDRTTTHVQFYAWRKFNGITGRQS